MSTTTPATVFLRLLRAPQLQAAGGAAHALSDRDAALLALLALDGPLPRARVAALIWPDVNAEQQRTSLRQRLFRLRQRVGQDVVDAGAVMALAGSVRTDLAEAAQLAEDPAALPGELLEGLGYADDELGRWVGAAREAWRAQRRDRLAATASAHEAEGRLAAAIAFAQRLAADEPLLEHAQRRLMRLHYLRGDSAAAMVVYETLRSAMQRELGTHPGAETLQLLRQVAAGAAPAAATAPRASAVLRTPRVIGREAEWALMAQAWDQARPLLLVAEAGVGKSRLMEDFTRERPGVVQVQARPGDALVPYALLARWVRALLEHAARPAARIELPEGTREALARVVVEFGAPGAVASAGRVDALRLQQACQALWLAVGAPPLAVDDLHHGDSASLDLLPALWQQPPARWLLATRATEMPPQLRGQGDGTEDGTLLQVPLPLLNAAQVAALLAALALPGLDGRWAQALHGHTQGNPLFLLETLRALLAEGVVPAEVPASLPLPPRVGLVIERRLAQLSATALHLARVAALAGQDFSLALAAALLQQPVLLLAEPWRELESAQVLGAGGFVHDLVLDATRRLVPAPVAMALHAQIAAFLQAQGVPAARLAMHWQAAQRWPEAAQAWLDAAQVAFNAARTDDSSRCRLAAIEAYGRAGLHDRVFEQSNYRLAELGEYGRGDELRAAAEAVLAMASTDEERMGALIMQAHVLHSLLAHEDSLAAAQQVEALLAHVEDPAVRAQGRIRLALALAHAGQPEAGQPLLDAVHPWVMGQDDARLRTMFLTQQANLLVMRDQMDAAQPQFSEALQGALAGQQVHLARQTAASAAGAQWRRGQWAAMQHTLHTLVTLRQGTEGGPSMQLHEDQWLALMWRHEGRYDLALPVLEQAVAAWRGRERWARGALAEHALLQLWLDLGQPARAAQLLGATPASRMQAWPAYARTERALWALRAGPAAERGAALAQLQRCVQTPAAAGRPVPHLLAQLELARHLEPAAGLALCRVVLDEAGRSGCEGVAALAQWQLPVLLQSAGHQAQATAAALRALAAHSPDVAVDRTAIEGWWALHGVLAQAGEAAAALALARAVQALQAARAHVPAPFVESFLHRHPVHRQVLGAVAG